MAACFCTLVTVDSGEILWCLLCVQCGTGGLGGWGGVGGFKVIQTLLWNFQSSCSSSSDCLCSVVFFGRRGFRASVLQYFIANRLVRFLKAHFLKAKNKNEWDAAVLLSDYRCKGSFEIGWRRMLAQISLLLKGQRQTWTLTKNCCSL